MEEGKQRTVSDKELEQIRKMREFRRALSVLVALLVLLAAVLLALISGLRQKPEARGGARSGLAAARAQVFPPVSPLSRQIINGPNYLEDENRCICAFPSTARTPGS